MGQGMAGGALLLTPSDLPTAQLVLLDSSARQGDTTAGTECDPFGLGTCCGVKADRISRRTNKCHQGTPLGLVRRRLELPHTSTPPLVALQVTLTPDT